jgi:NAD(P)-dependent dehydrogenase (short-subunit alcohol dehydrogenase family)
MTIQKLINLKGKVALITGGAGYLGLEAASALAELGASIVLVDINESSLELASGKLLKNFSVPVMTILTDLEVESEILKIPSKVEQQFSKIDILINNAAFVGTSGLDGWVTKFDKQTTSTWRRALEINLTAPFTLVQACLSLLHKSNQASIINIGSIYGMLGPDMSLYEGTNMGNPAAYAASKGGLIQFTRWASTVLSPEIRVNTITPGGIARNQPKEFSERYIARTPLNRMATEEDFIGAIVYLSTGLSSYVTGQNIVVDGGWSVW